uniref:Uncharacterized protein n=1 Tax=Heterorhabditis bacteriophora TaxID=37862 RepID=A0A1I7WEF0_HETBA
MKTYLKRYLSNTLIFVPLFKNKS